MWYHSVCMMVCVWVGRKEEGTEERRGRMIERRKIDAVSVSGADPVCLGDI